MPIRAATAGLIAGLVQVATLAAGQPLAPVALVADAGAAQLTLTWEHPNPAAVDTYLIERSPPANACTFGPVGSATLLTFIDTPLADGVEWCYRVVAVNAVGESAPSTVACGTTLGGPPPGDPPPVTITFVRNATTPGPFLVPIGAYTCRRIVGGTAQVHLLLGSTLLKSVNLANPPQNVPFTMTCALTPTTVSLAIDSVIKATAPR